MDEMTLEQITDEASHRLVVGEAVATVGLNTSVMMMALTEAPQDLRDTAHAFLWSLAQFMERNEDRLRELRDLYQARTGEVADLEKLLGES